jgi:hypothetical protein
LEDSDDDGKPDAHTAAHRHKIAEPHAVRHVVGIGVNDEVMVDDSDGHAATDANTITDAVCINHHFCFCDRFIDSYPAANADADIVSHCLSDSVEFAFG